MQTFIRNVREMSGGVSGVSPSTSLAIEQDDLGALLFEQVSGGNPGQTGSNYDHVRLQVAVKGWKNRKTGRRAPGTVWYS